MSTKAAALSVCTAAAVAALAAVLVTDRAPKTNIFTATRLDFERLLAKDEGNEWFPRNSRCSKKTFVALVSFLNSRNFEFKNLTAREHSFSKKVAGVLNFLASSASYRTIGDAMGMNESVHFEAVDDLSEFLADLLSEIVRFPDTMAEWRRIEQQFRCKRGFPGVVGAVDGSLIAIQRPADFNGFYCRKNYPVINVQGIVDADQKFMAIDMYPGSWSDKKMWKYAPSSRRFRENMPIETHLLGDSGYTLYPRLITPFLEREEGGQLSRMQSRFNFLHSSTRMTVECTFGKWKGRFRKLMTVMSEKDVKKACQLIAATAVLHNLFEMLADDTQIEIVREPPDDEVDFGPVSATTLRAIAVSKRNAIMSLITR